jgi:hypothetical protein
VLGLNLVHVVAIPPPRPAKSVSSSVVKGMFFCEPLLVPLAENLCFVAVDHPGSPSPICSSVEDGYIKIRHHPTGSTNASSTSLHTMSPLSGSMQNVAALTGGNAGSTGSLPLRRVPPALPSLPGRPVPARATRSTLDVVDEKSKLSPSSVLGIKPRETPEQKLSTVGVNESYSGGGSGVARLIAEANRRAVSTGVLAEASVQSTASTMLALSPKESTSIRPVPALPVRTITPVNGDGIRTSAPDFHGGVPKSHDTPPALPRQPPRKGSLNATTRKSSMVPETAGISIGTGVRGMSVDSVGHVRRMPPVLNDSALAGEKNNGNRTGDTEGANEEKKKPRPAVPPKPISLVDRN